MNMLRVTTSAMVILALVLVSSSAVAGEWTDTDVFVDAEEAATLIDEGAAVVDAREAETYRRGHIPGAGNLHWQQFVDGDTSGELIDDDDRLGGLVEAAGVHEDRPVVVYGAWDDDGWGEEGRIFWTLEYLGHDQVHLMVGGLTAWNRAGQPVANSNSEVESGDFTVQRRDQRRATTDEIRHRINGGGGVALLDTRERAEYEGVVKYGEARGGHIPGAEHLWWEDLVDEQGLISPDELERKLEQRGISTDDDIIAYCTGGVRSGFVYTVLRAAGFDSVKNYDASMWEWTSNGLPVQ